MQVTDWTHPFLCGWPAQRATISARDNCWHKECSREGNIFQNSGYWTRVDQRVGRGIRVQVEGTVPGCWSSKRIFLAWKRIIVLWVLFIFCNNKKPVNATWILWYSGFLNFFPSSPGDVLWSWLICTVVGLLQPGWTEACLDSDRLLGSVIEGLAAAPHLEGLLLDQASPLRCVPTCISENNDKNICRRGHTDGTPPGCQQWNPAAFILFFYFVIWFHFLTFFDVHRERKNGRNEGW